MARTRSRFAWMVLLPLAAAPLLPVSCHDAPGPSSASSSNDPWFEDVTPTSGIQHAYDTGQSVPGFTFDGQPLLSADKRNDPKTANLAGHFAMLEQVGGGGGLIDFDGDGLLDVFLPGGGTYTGPNNRTIVGRPCKLYKNLGNFQFQDVTREVGLDRIDFYTHGVAVADYNNDGWPDLLVTGWGRLALFRNDPVDPNDPTKGRKFTDVTKEAHLDDHLWSSGAAWADFDGDGHVDLYVAHYLDWHFGKTSEEDKKSNEHCIFEDGLPDYCPPNHFGDLPHILYRNNGDGTFSDVSKSAGLHVPRKEEDYKSLHAAYVEEARQRLHGQVPDDQLDASAKHAADIICDRLRQGDSRKDYGKGLGVLTVDINGDGKPDLFVANDTTDNWLYVNRSRPGRILFEESALSAGVARDGNGQQTGNMGVDAFDYDGSLRPSLWTVNYRLQTHSLFWNNCSADNIVFTYATQIAGIGAIGQHYVGWGTRFVDFDLSGAQHLFISNGHIQFNPIGESRRQKPMLMRCAEPCDGRRVFKDVTAQHGGAYCAREHCGRGVAFGDLDNDGRVDMVLIPLDEPVAVLKTIAGQGNHWIGFHLKRKGHRDPVGAKVILEAGGKKQVRFAKGGGSYISANDPRHVFGLGRGQAIDKVTVIWPDLSEQTWEGLAVDRYWNLIEGEKDAQPAKREKTDS